MQCRAAKSGEAHQSALPSAFSTAPRGTRPGALCLFQVSAAGLTLRFPSAGAASPGVGLGGSRDSPSHSRGCSRSWGQPWPLLAGVAAAALCADGAPMPSCSPLPKHRSRWSFLRSKWVKTRIYFFFLKQENFHPQGQHQRGNKDTCVFLQEPLLQFAVPAAVGGELWGSAGGAGTGDGSSPGDWAGTHPAPPSAPQQTTVSGGNGGPQGKTQPRMGLLGLPGFSRGSALLRGDLHPPGLSPKSRAGPHPARPAAGR